MANKPFDREVINTLERPVSGDFNLGQSYWAQAMSDLAYRLFSTRATLSSDLPNFQPPVGDAGFIGSSFKIRSITAAMQVRIDAGIGYYNDNTPSTNVGGVVGVNDQELIKPLVLSVAETINVPAADPTNPRVDIIEVKIGRAFADATTRDVLNPSAAAFAPTVVNKTLTYALDGTSTINGAGAINYKTGTPAATPTAPATDAGYALIGMVRVPAAAAQIGATCVMDLRRLLVEGGSLRVAGWAQWSGVSGTQQLFNLEAPPGVEATVTSAGGNGTIYVKAGDAMKYRADTTLFGNNICGSVMPATGTTGQITTAIVDAPTAAQLAASHPPLYVMVGQPVLTLPLGSFSPTGVSQVAFAGVVQY